MTTFAYTRADIEACLAECVSTSNWYFDEQNWPMAEQWHLRAVEWQAKLDRFDAEQAHHVS